MSLDPVTLHDLTRRVAAKLCSEFPDWSLSQSEACVREGSTGASGWQLARTEVTRVAKVNLAPVEMKGLKRARSRSPFAPGRTSGA